MRVITLPALSDNYIFVLRQGDEAAVVDPGEAGPVLAYLAREPARLTAILTTHHHGDHVGGNRALCERFPGVVVVGSAEDRARIPGLTRGLGDGDEVAVAGITGRLLAVPGHTRGHVAYFFPAADGRGGDLFAGDTVFGGTIGNLFEGTPEVMFRSIEKIRALPSGTRLWCAHEYTRQYVREAAAIDPHNARLAARLRALDAAPPGAPTVPLLLDEECATNPFFRWDAPDLTAHLGTAPGLATFQRLCEIT
ncbi:MAG TPA: hydroxyacylglutathione hydrolase [Polyangia bacterium]|jgi:hydroxyacylglutathione hydrolase